MAVDGGRVLGSAATGAAMGTAIMPGWGTAIGAIGGGLVGLLGGSDGNAAPAPAPTQYGGNPLANQLAAQQYAAGLQQQQAQNAREAAFYNQSNGNYDIANAAQLRGGPQISSSQSDVQRQLDALRGTNSAVGNVNQTGQQLTALGTRPMGASYAEAQLRQGQDAAMAQQLAMARSGRSLGSGQASMNQAMFNNAALNQQTNQAAASARIQEQNAYNQFQAGALGAAGQQYGAAGALSGQAGNQATGVRQGNEAVQLQNATLQQNQQGINNQTTGLYNQLGAQQQGFGMQANNLGQQANQFGANQASGALGAQLNADTGRLSSSTATNIANQNNANAHDAATVNAVASGAGAVADAWGNANATPSAPANPNNPSGSTSPYRNITTSANTAGPGTPGARNSDERLKTNIKALTPGSSPGPIAEPPKAKPGLMRAPVHTPEGYTAEAGGGYASPDRKTFITDQGKTLNFKYGMDTPMDDQDLGKKPSPGESPGPQPPSYAETIAALNQGYRASQFAPTDVLNRVPGAGAGPSASQSAVIDRMMGRAPSTLGRPEAAKSAGGIDAALAAKDPRMGQYAPVSSLTGLAKGAGFGATPSAPAAPAPQSNWSDVFNQPELDPRIQAYLYGASPYPVAAPSAPAPAPAAPPPPITTTDQYRGGPSQLGTVDNMSGPSMRTSDVHSKTRIRELEGQLAALSGDAPTARFADAARGANMMGFDGVRPTRGGWEYAKDAPWGGDAETRAAEGLYPSQRTPDFGALDDAYAREQNAPAVDLRPAQGYEYQYKNPNAPGSAPGRHVGPMAQDLERTAAAGTVRDTPRGKVVDTEGLTMVNTAALSEQQRKTQEIERELAALQAAQPAPYSASLYPRTRSPY